MATTSFPESTISKHAIIWLLLSLSITFTLYAFNLENWVPACFVVFAIWRYLIEIKKWAYPKLWLRLPLSIAGGLAVLATYGTLFGRDASVGLLAVMISMKLLETRTKRDFIVMVILSYFLTINTLLFTQAIWVFIAILFALTGLTTCLISTSHEIQTAIEAKILMKSNISSQPTAYGGG